MSEYTTTSQVSQLASVGIDWSAFWLSLGFSAFASLVWWQMLLGYGPVLQGPKAIGLLLYSLAIALGAVVVTSPLAYIYAKQNIGGNTIKSLWKFIFRFILVGVVIGVIAFFALLGAGAGGGGGYGMLAIALIAGVIIFIFFIKAILLSLLLVIPIIHRKKVQYVLLIFTVLIYLAQFFGFGRFGLIE